MEKKNKASFEIIFLIISIIILAIISYYTKDDRYMKLLIFTIIFIVFIFLLFCIIDLNGI